MVRAFVRPAVGGRPGMMWRIVLGLVIGVLSASALHAQQPPAQAAPAPSQFVFAGDAVVTLNFIKADKAADFEMVIGRLKDALAKSDKPERKQQAAGWKMFKSTDASPTGSVIYVSIIDPVVKGADYTVTKILNEAFPTEVQALYKAYSEAYVSLTPINLSLLKDMK